MFWFFFFWKQSKLIAKKRFLISPQLSRWWLCIHPVPFDLKSFRPHTSCPWLGEGRGGCHLALRGGCEEPFSHRRSCYRRSFPFLLSFREATCKLPTKTV